MTINNAVTVDINTIIGNSPAEGNYVITVGTTGSLTIPDGVQLTVRGSFSQSGPITIGAGSIIEFDSSLSSDPVNTNYLWNLSVTGSSTTLIINGTPTNHAIIRSNTSGGNAYLTAGGNLNLGRWAELYCDWYDFGDTGHTTAISIKQYNSTSGIQVVGSSYNNLDGKINYESGNSSPVTIDKMETRGSTVSPIIVMNVDTAANSGIIRNFTNNWIDSQVLWSHSSMGSWVLDNTLFTRINSNAVATQPIRSAKNNIFLDRECNTGMVGFGNDPNNTLTDTLFLSNNRVCQ